MQYSKPCWVECEWIVNVSLWKDVISLIVTQTLNDGPGRAGPVEKLGPALCFKLQNYMAHIWRSDRATSILTCLHRLKIADRIDYKSQTIYLFSLNRFNTSVRQLRSSERLNRLYIDVSKMVFESHSFYRAPLRLRSGTYYHAILTFLIVSSRLVCIATLSAGDRYGRSATAIRQISDRNRLRKKTV